jgi:TfoX/Sxy family transcriptional regulator of competence genes
MAAKKAPKKKTASPAQRAAKNIIAKKAVAKKATKKPAAKKAVRPMPKLEKSSPALLQAFAQTMATLPMAQTKTVFGSPAAFANGHMFAGIQNESFFLRLPDADRESFMQTVSARQWEPMAGRPMREYVVVPAPLIEAPDDLNAWLGKSIAYVQSLPPKAAKAKKK